MFYPKGVKRVQEDVYKYINNPRRKKSHPTLEILPTLGKVKRVKMQEQRDRNSDRVSSANYL